MTRQEAIVLLHSKLKNENLRRHCYATEAVMRGLAEKLNEDKDTWGITGLLHDADYEIVKDTPSEHTHMTLKWLEPLDVDKNVRDAILAHGWGFVDGNPEPKGAMQWSLYCCDELTGLIVAVALVKPDKSLKSVTVESVLNKWNQKSFASGVHREQIELCKEKLNIELEEFISIAIKSMQNIHKDLRL